MDWNFRDGCRSYGADLFDRRLHNLVLVPAQLKHDGGSSNVPAAGMGLPMPSSPCAARATLRQWQGLLRLGLITALSEGGIRRSSTSAGPSMPNLLENQKQVVLTCVTRLKRCPITSLELANMDSLLDRLKQSRRIGEVCRRGRKHWTCACRYRHSCGPHHNS